MAFLVIWDPLGLGVGRVDGWGFWWVGVTPGMCTHAHIHVYTCLHVHTPVCMCLCMQACRGTPHVPKHFLTHLPLPRAGGPKSLKCNETWIYRDNWILFKDLWALYFPALIWTRFDVQVSHPKMAFLCFRPNKVHVFCFCFHTGTW